MQKLRYAAGLVVLLVASRSSRLAVFRPPVWHAEDAQHHLRHGRRRFGTDNINLKLDLYEPKDIGEDVPVLSPGIVLIHGGGFVSGDKSTMSMLATTYASHGYVVVSINYRLMGDNPPPEPGPAANLVPPPPPYPSLPNPEGGYAINAAIQDSIKAGRLDATTRPR